MRRFVARAQPMLERRPVEHNVLLTLLADLASTPVIPQAAAPLCVRVDTAGAVAGFGLSTPLRPLLLSRMPSAAIAALVDLLATTTPQLAAVDGLEPEPATFARAWQRQTGRAVSQRSAQRLYQLDHVLAPVGVSGASRLARVDELDELGTWAAAFSAETGQRTVDLRAHLARRLAQQRLFVWDDGGTPVAMAALSHPIAGVVRVSLVYTPPSRRRRGYASALVAAISQRALDQGGPHLCAVHRCGQRDGQRHLPGDRLSAAVRGGRVHLRASIRGRAWRACAMMPATQLELLQIEIETIWPPDERGRINGPDLVIASSSVGSITAIGSAVPDDLAAALKAVVSAVTPSDDVSSPPAALAPATNDAQQTAGAQPLAPDPGIELAGAAQPAIGPGQLAPLLLGPRANKAAGTARDDGLLEGGHAGVPELAANLVERGVRGRMDTAAMGWASPSNGGGDVAGPAIQICSCRLEEDED